MSIAFFDLDKTLLAHNSATLWVRSELRRGHLTRYQALRAGIWLLRYRFGDVALEQAISASIQTLKGKQESILRARTLAFYENEVRHTVRPGALKAMAHHRQQGHRLALLTSSSQYLSHAVAEDFQFDDVLCTIIDVDAGGYFTGRTQRLCYGEGKCSAAASLARVHDVALSECTFYTDSLSDAPALEIVGRPVAVNPDPRLRRLASRKGWEVVDWGEPTN